MTTDRPYPMLLTLDRAYGRDAKALRDMGVSKVLAVGYYALVGWLVVKAQHDEEGTFLCAPHCFAEFEGSSDEHIRKTGKWLNEQRRKSNDL